MQSRYFVTGTDTGVGKTLISLGLMQKLQDAGIETLGVKPVASGCEATADGLRNADALALQQQSSRPLAYEQVNPYAFAPPIAPHLAARDVGVILFAAELQSHCVKLQTYADGMVVEGVGGWLVPINERQTMADLASALQLPVVMVVGMRLGCINHALLTAESISAYGVPLAGWVANHIEPDLDHDAQLLAAIGSRLGVPLLGSVPYLESAQRNASTVASYLVMG